MSVAPRLGSLLGDRPDDDGKIALGEGDDEQPFADRGLLAAGERILDKLRSGCDRIRDLTSLRRPDDGDEGYDEDAE